MTGLFSYKLIHSDSRARAGTFETPHGLLQTPVFAPVGTQATVKAVTPSQLRDLGASLVLSNTYHLYLRPGAELVAEMGGLHNFMQWQAPMLTDSGGFQVFSLAASRKVDADGVTFKSHIDGSQHRFTPEKAIGIEELLGADIIMAFDECSQPDDRPYVEKSIERTHAWAERCLIAKTRPDQALFGIIQGGIYPDLREKSARFITALDFPGYAIGGLSVGETKTQMHEILDLVDTLMPTGKPRYLMGVGSPEDLINGIRRGVDIFDCVLPTRLARHSSAFTSNGRINLMNAGFAHDTGPIDPDCGCYTCQTFNRAYLRHLIVSKEMLASTLISIHNLYFLVHLVNNARQAILDNRYQVFADEFLAHYKTKRK